MSLDFTNAKARQRLLAALNSENPEDFVSAISEMAQNMQNSIMEDFKAYQQTGDEEILAKRGIKPLTSKEKKFYNALREGLKAGDAKAAFTNIESGLPVETMSRMLVDMRAEFPLLDEINLTDNAAVTKILKNKQGTQLSAWGALGSQITNNLNGNLEEVDLTLCKLVSVVPVSVDMLDAGIEWLDAYCRGILVEANGSALCAAVASGTGKNMPIGMIKNLNGTVSNGEYPNKTAKSITYLDTETLGDIYTTLCVNSDTSKQREVGETIFVVNPVTYYGKVIPAIRTYAADGSYKDALPFPIKFILEPTMDNNKAVLGIGKKYMLGVGTGGKKGNQTYSDEIGFLDDLRYYKQKTYANGFAEDNNAFVYLNLANLVKKPITVNTVDVTPADEG